MTECDEKRMCEGAVYFRNCQRKEHGYSLTCRVAQGERAISTARRAPSNAKDSILCCWLRKSCCASLCILPIVVLRLYKRRRLTTASKSGRHGRSLDETTAGGVIHNVQHLSLRPAPS